MNCPSLHPTARVLGQPVRCWHGEGHQGLHGNMHREWNDYEEPVVSVVLDFPEPEIDA